VDDPEQPGIPWLDGVWVTGPFPPLFDSGITGQSTIKVDEFVDTVSWECGNFHYYVPDISSDQWTAKAVSALFGVTPTPSVLYSVYPWTWLVDWFTNVGDIVSNMSANAVDNEVLTNCFVMREVTTRREINVRTRWDSRENGSLHFGYHYFIPAGSDEMTYSLLRRHKLRHQASPFGFGWDQSALTARQRSILAAIVVDRHSGQLKFRRGLSL
jgi:hypothetical protein